jgi:hypothetical protein
MTWRAISARPYSLEPPAKGWLMDPPPAPAAAAAAAASAGAHRDNAATVAPPAPVRETGVVYVTHATQEFNTRHTWVDGKVGRCRLTLA